MCSATHARRRRNRRGGVLAVLALLLAALVGLARPAAAGAAGVSFVSTADDVTFAERSDIADRPWAAEVVLLNGSAVVQTLCLTSDAPQFGPVTMQIRPECAPVAGGATQRFVLTRAASTTNGFELVASSDDGTVARLAVPSSAPEVGTVRSWTQRWWDEIAIVSLQVLVEIVLLGMFLSVLANWAADGLSATWRRLPRPAYLRAAGYLVAIIGALDLLLERSAAPGTVAGWAWLHGQPGWFGWGVALVLLALAAVAVVEGRDPVRGAVLGHRHEWPADAPVRSWFADERRRRRSWLVTAASAVATAILGLLWERPAAGWQSTGLGFLMVAAGFVLVTWQSAYCPRLTLPDGSDDDKAGVVAAVRDALSSLTPDAARRISLAVGPDTASVAADALAPLPGNAWMKALLQVRDALVPHAGLRLRLWSSKETTPPDDTTADPRVRIHAVLERGRRQVAADLIDSDDFHPEAHVRDRTAHDSTAEAASALAAWLLLTVGDEVKARDWGLYRTTSWRSLALQMAGSRRDEAGDTEGARALFNRACGEDEHNLPARFNTISARTAALFPASGQDAARQRTTRDQLAALRQLVDERFPGSPLALRAAYLEVATLLYHEDPIVRSGAAERAQALLATLTQLGVDPFAHVRSPDLKARLVHDLGAVERVRSRDLPRGDDARRTREYGAFVAPSAMVLWFLAAANDAAAADGLAELRKRVDVPVRARYNAGCALLGAPALVPDRADGRAEAWSEIRTAMIDEHLARWALRGPVAPPALVPGPRRRHRLPRRVPRSAGRTAAHRGAAGGEGPGGLRSTGPPRGGAADGGRHRRSDAEGASRRRRRDAGAVARTEGRRGARPAGVGARACGHPGHRRRGRRAAPQRGRGRRSRAAGGGRSRRARPRPRPAARPR